MFFSTLFTLFGLGALCWILFNLAVYALPFAIGLTSGMYSLRASSSAASSPLWGNSPLTASVGPRSNSPSV